MGKIRRAIANFIRSRRAAQNVNQMFGAALIAEEWAAAARRDCRHVWGVKRDAAYGFPVDGSEAVCVYCGVTASAQEGSNNG